MYNKYYNEGYKAYNDGKDVTDNPYHMDEFGHHEWYDGWLAAQEHAYNEGN